MRSWLIKRRIAKYQRLYIRCVETAIGIYKAEGVRVTPVQAAIYHRAIDRLVYLLNATGKR